MPSPTQNEVNYTSQPPKTLKLSEFDQLAARVYVRWLLCFPTDTQPYPSKSNIVQSIESGITSTITTLPFLRGNIIPRANDSSRVDVLIQSLNTINLVVRHFDGLTDETIIPYAELRQREFPTSALPGDVLSPFGFAPPAGAPAPVFAVQATFIRGGLILCVCLHHSTVDGIGMGAVISLLARNCPQSTSAYTALDPQPPSARESTATGDPLIVDRSILDPPPDTQKLQHDEYVVTPPLDSQAPRLLPPPVTATCLRIFAFPPSSLRTLKTLCNTPSPSPSSAKPAPIFHLPPITAHSALTALIYATVSTARSLRLRRTSPQLAPSSQSSRISIAVNGRTRLSPTLAPNSFLGNLVVGATFTTPFPLPIAAAAAANDDDSNTALPPPSTIVHLAHRIHACIARIDARHVFSTLALAASLDDISRLQTAAGQAGPGRDLVVTSWAELGMYGDTWWEGGRVEAVRVPGAEVDGLCVVLPRRGREEGLEVMLGLGVEDMRGVEVMLRGWGVRVCG
ncbi:hypothetical protein MMC21_007838 [Puttea exsequens]|nr:hypothetical protein [Puttea exsequens]